MTSKHEPKYHKFVKKLLHTEKKEALKGLFKDLNPVEIAQALGQLKVKYQLQAIQLLSAEQAAQVMPFMRHNPLLQALLAEIEVNRLSDIVAEMARDDAADFIALLDEEKADLVLENLNTRDRREIRNLLQYDQESAGGIMDPHVVAVPKDINVGQATAHIRRYIEENENIETFYTIYVVDEYHHLVGYLETTQLLLAPDNTPIKDLLHADIVAVDVGTDQEEVARIAR